MRKGNYRNIPIVQYDIKIGTIVSFEGQYEASLSGFNTSKIGACCNKREFSHKGHFWFYKKDFNLENLKIIFKEHTKPRRTKVFMEYKVCIKCKIKKHYLDFHKGKRGYSGTRSDCKKCNSHRVWMRVKNNTLVRLSARLRIRTYHALKNGLWNKKYKLNQYLGCSMGNLKIHLESKFIDGMSWENYGKWHLDHIYPLSRAKTESEVYELFHYTNLQPLWAIDNARKGNKVL